MVNEKGDVIMTFPPSGVVARLEEEARAGFIPFDYGMEDDDGEPITCNIPVTTTKFGSCKELPEEGSEGYLIVSVN